MGCGWSGRIWICAGGQAVSELSGGEACEGLDGLRTAYGYNFWEVAFKIGVISTAQYSGSIIQKTRLDKDVIIDNSQEYYDAYKKHHVFDEIDHMIEFYDCISYSSSSFAPNGTLNIGNYEANMYQSIRTTLDSII